MPAVARAVVGVPGGRAVLEEAVGDHRGAGGVVVAVVGEEPRVGERACAARVPRGLRRVGGLAARVELALRAGHRPEERPVLGVHFRTAVGGVDDVGEVLMVAVPAAGKRRRARVVLDARLDEGVRVGGGARVRIVQVRYQDSAEIFPGIAEAIAELKIKGGICI